MLEGIHDSLLVAYSVSSESKSLVLSLHPQHGSAPAPFEIVFQGVIAHCFEAPLLPAILLEIETLSAEILIAEDWQRIEQGQKANGWPGSWATSLANATQFVRSMNVQGFVVKSSYGLSGWVIAKSVGRAVAG